MAHSRNRSSGPTSVYYSTPADCEAPRFVPPPRIPVTNSTLFAYQIMRGNNGSGEVQHGPLYDALYFFPRDRVPPGLVDLKVNLVTPSGDEDIGPDNLIFWDPSEQTNFQEPQINEHPRHVGSPTLPNPNHYSGGQGFANYGYILLNGVWVDPETKSAMRALKEPHLVRPPPHFSLLSQGPRSVMTFDEESSFYEEYVTDLVEDFEADPRNYRISPATFARWAVGASPGDHYESAIFPINSSPHRPTISIPRPRIAPVVPQPQFDIETGSVLSGEYDVGRTPSPLWSAQGLDMSRQPVDFFRMDPQAGLDIDRAAFGTPESRTRTQEWLDSSTDSTPSVYNSEAACEELASPGDPQSGVDRYNIVKRHIENLSNDLQASRERNQQKDQINREMDQIKWRMERENFLMKRHIEQKQGHGRPPAFAYTPPASESPPPSPEIQPRRARGQYERYLREREKLERIAIEKEAQSARNMNVAHAGMLSCLERLGEINDFLFEHLAPEDRAGFIPSQDFAIPEWG